jgi:hypothetical protein
MPNWFAGVADRAVRTALQTLAGYLALAHTVTEVAWLPALSAAGFAVVLSLLTALVGSPSFGESWLFQVAERSVKTFAQSLLAGIGAATMFAEVDWKMALNAAALAAVASVVTSVLTSRAGSDLARGQVDLTVPRTGRSTPETSPSSPSWAANKAPATHALPLGVVAGASFCVYRSSPTGEPPTTRSTWTGPLAGEMST